MQYICDTVLENHEAVSGAVTEHTIEVYGQRSYSVVDMSVYSAQQAKLQAARDRGVDIGFDKECFSYS